MAQRAAVTTIKVPEVELSASAARSIAVRDLDPESVKSFVRDAAPSDYGVDPESGMYVYRDGDLRIVAKKEGDKLVILTTLSTKEMAPLLHG